MATVEGGALGVFPRLPGALKHDSTVSQSGGRKSEVRCGQGGFLLGFVCCHLSHSLACRSIAWIFASVFT